MVDTETGELWERSLGTRARRSTAFLSSTPGQTVRVGIEAVGNSQCLSRCLVRDVGTKLWIGDAAQIRGWLVRLQKTDRRDAKQHSGSATRRTVSTVVVPSTQMRDVRQLLRHRQKLVEIRTQVKNQLQHLALNQGVRRKRRLWSVQGRAVLEQLPLQGWTARRRSDLLAMLDRLEEQVGELDRAVRTEAEQRPEVRLLMTHPGVGPVVGLGVCADDWPDTRFPRGKQVPVTWA